MLNFIGDQQGSRRFLSVLCVDSASPSTHRSEPSNSAAAGYSQTSAYLRSRGVFQFPEASICDALVRCYFRHVHFFMPVVNAETVLAAYSQNQCQSMSPLLLWSIFLAAANVGECF